MILIGQFILLYRNISLATKLGNVTVSKLVEQNKRYNEEN